MLQTRWRKILRDLWNNKSRTVLVVLSITIGVFMVGTVAHMHILVSDDLAASYAEVRPANAAIFTEDPFDDDLVQAIDRMDGVQAAEGRRSATLRFKREEDDPWQMIQIFAIPDYDDIRVNKVKPEGTSAVDPEKWPAGTWPPPDEEVVLERTSLLVGYLGLTQAELGDSITIETTDEREREVRLAGLSYDFARIPATFAGRAYGYVTFDTLEWLGEPRTYNELYILVEHARDEAQIKLVADEVRDKVEKSGRAVTRTEVYTPGQLPLDNYFRGFTVVLGTMGVVALFLSVFLVTNTISALLAQQVKQIGMMKAIGARTSQIVPLYLVMVLIFGVLALCIAVPIGLQVTAEFVSFLAYFLNFKLSEFRLPMSVIVLEAALALLVPLLAALMPILSGTRITVREAISGQGIGERTFGQSRIDRLIERVRGLPRPVLMSLRNVFRRKVRLTLTLLTLTLGSSIFISVFSVRASLFETYEEALAASQHDVEVLFERPYRTTQIEQEAQQISSVVTAESWSGSRAYRVRDDESESELFSLTALPADTDLFQPVVIQGRWLLPNDENAVVLTTEVLAEEPDIAVGDDIELTIGSDETTWRVVGVVQGLLAQPIIYVNEPYFARTVGEVGRASSVRVATEQGESVAQAEVAQALREHFEALGLRVIATQTEAEQREQTETLFNIIIFFLMGMAMLVAAVGGLGLMGMMSLNTIERTREIGVMRAIGASNGAILQIVIVEGLFIGMLSWLAGLIIAFPLSYGLSIAVGMAFLQIPLTYTFSAQGALIWLGLVGVLAILASVLPARHAASLTVRDVLAYE